MNESEDEALNLNIRYPKHVIIAKTYVIFIKKM